MPGWPGSSRPSGSSGTAMTWWSTAAASSRPGRCGTRSRSGWRECGLELHPDKTRIVYCKDDDEARLVRAQLVHVPGVHVPRAQGPEQAREVLLQLHPGRQRRGGQAHAGARSAPGGCTCAVDKTLTDLARSSTRSCGAGSTTTGGSTRPRCVRSSAASTTTWCGGPCRNTSGTAGKRTTGAGGVAAGSRSSTRPVRPLELVSRDRRTAG